MTLDRSGGSRLSRQPLDTVLATLGTSRDGLSADEAAHRLALGGAADPSAAHLRLHVLEFLRASANPLVIILLVAGVASALFGEVTSALIIGGIVLLS
ncbi:MAG TPA: cation-transporting P-type ATPase, partial [Gemmatimonadaceae bacterium]